MGRSWTSPGGTPARRGVGSCSAPSGPARQHGHRAAAAGHRAAAAVGETTSCTHQRLALTLTLTLTVSSSGSPGGRACSDLAERTDVWVLPESRVPVPESTHSRHRARVSPSLKATYAFGSHRRSHLRVSSRAAAPLAPPSFPPALQGGLPHSVCASSLGANCEARRQARQESECEASEPPPAPQPRHLQRVRPVGGRAPGAGSPPCAHPRHPLLHLTPNHRYKEPSQRD